MRRERWSPRSRGSSLIGVQIDTERTLVPTNFFAAYQGVDDRPLHEKPGPRLPRPRREPPGTGRGEARPAAVTAACASASCPPIPRSHDRPPQSRPHPAARPRALRGRRAQHDAQPGSDRDRVRGGRRPLRPHPARTRRARADGRRAGARPAAVHRRRHGRADVHARLQPDGPGAMRDLGAPGHHRQPDDRHFLSSALLETAGAEAHYTEQLARPRASAPTTAARAAPDRRSLGAGSASALASTSTPARRPCSSSIPSSTRCWPGSCAATRTACSC